MSAATTAGLSVTHEARAGVDISAQAFVSDIKVSTSITASLAEVNVSLGARVAASGGQICTVGEPFVYLSEQSIVLDAENNTYTIYLTATRSWEVVGIPKGFGLSRYNGEAGVKIPLIITLASQESFTEPLMVRCGDFVISASVKYTQDLYTRLSYLESTGEQYINTGYVVQEDDIIEMQYTKFERTTVDEYMFGASDSNGNLWAYVNSNSIYPRFGSDAQPTLSSTRWKNILTVQRGSVNIDGTTGTLSLDGMPQVPLYIFARNNNGIAESFATIKTVGVTITKASGAVVMKLRPCKRDTDGAVGMIDLVSGQFFPNQGSGATFSYGGEAHISAEYDILDYLTCANDKVFDTNVYSNETTYVELLFRRTNYAAAEYIYGCSSTSDRRFTAYLTTSGYWRHGSGYALINCKDGLLHYGYVTPSKITVDNSSRSFTISAYTSPFTVPVGGYKPATGIAQADYQGHIYYFRMWHGEEIVVDYIPCKRLSDGVEGFWDCVTQTFIEPL